ncbi:MAG: hypothetical protein Q7S44_03035 [bacterium]|nr:hypothetical protein [bacterium]
MYNWNIDTTELKKDSRKYTKWKLEQMINFGLNGEKIKEKELRKYWHELDIDLARRKVLVFWLWHKQS